MKAKRVTKRMFKPEALRSRSIPIRCAVFILAHGAYAVIIIGRKPITRKAAKLALYFIDISLFGHVKTKK